MNIAIVDDEAVMRVSLLHFINKRKAQIPEKLNIWDFPDGDSFLESCKENSYDLVFLDIYMEYRNGIETAEQLRAMGSDALVVFLTSSSEHMIDAFDLHAFGYLTKPLLPEKLYKVLEDALSVKGPQRPILQLAVGKSLTVPIYYDDILYLNSDSNYCEVHTTTDFHRSRIPFATLEEELESSPQFLKINRGLLVNMDYVEKMDGTLCYLNNEEILPMNTKRCVQFKQDLISYQFSKKNT